jgi:hypothetical protein
MEGLRGNLSDDGDDKDADEDNAADRITQIHRHGDGVATGFSQGRGKNLDEPERDCDRRHLAWRRFNGSIPVGRPVGHACATRSIVWHVGLLSRNVAEFLRPNPNSFVIPNRKKLADG